MLAPSPGRRSGVGASLRATLSRGRRPAAPLGGTDGSPRATTSRRSTCTSTPPAGSPSGAWSARSTCPAGPPAPRTGRCFRTRGSTRTRPRPRRPDAEDAAQPGADPARAPRPRRRPRSSCGRCSRPAPDRRFTDRAEQRHRVWAIRDADGSGRVAPRPGRRPRPDRRRPPPVRRLPAAAAGAIRAPPGTAAWPCSSTRTTPRCSSAPSTGCCAGSRCPALADGGGRPGRTPCCICSRRRRAGRARPGHPRRHRRTSLGHLALALADDRARRRVLHDEVLPRCRPPANDRLPPLGRRGPAQGQRGTGTWPS